MSKRIILESPFANTDRNKFNENYFYLCLVARKLMKEDNHSPLFFHALYTQFLHDNSIQERDLGIKKSLDWHTFGDFKLYAIDRNISKGMIIGALDAIEKGVRIQFYSAMPTYHWINRRLAKINCLTDNENRWNAGVAFIKELEDIEEMKERFDATGDLTGYTDFNSDTIDDVKNCILEFFAPLVDHIRNERG